VSGIRDTLRSVQMMCPEASRPGRQICVGESTSVGHRRRGRSSSVCRRTTSAVLVMLSTIIATLIVAAGPAAAEEINCFGEPVDSRSLCYIGGSIQSAATGKWIGVGSGGVLNAAGLVHGWYQHIRFDYMLDWDGGACAWWTLEFAVNSRIASAPASGGIVRADSTFIGWYQAFRISWLGHDELGAYYGVQHLASGKWLSAGNDGSLLANATTVPGWWQAFRIPSLDDIFGDRCP